MQLIIEKHCTFTNRSDYHSLSQPDSDMLAYSDFKLKISGWPNLDVYLQYLNSLGIYLHLLYSSEFGVSLWNKVEFREFHIDVRTGGEES